MSDDKIEVIRYYIDSITNNILQESKLNTGQSTKSAMDNYMMHHFNMYRIKPYIIIDDPVNSDKYIPKPREKDWESKIPHHDPFYRTFSSPSDKTRARARAKRKKK